MRRKVGDLNSWLRHVDVNGLSDEEARQIAHIDIEDDAQLDWLAINWLRPRFLEMDDLNRRDFREILNQFDSFPAVEVGRVFADVFTPSGQTINDIPRFMAALRKAAVE